MFDDADTKQGQAYELNKTDQSQADLITGEVVSPRFKPEPVVHQNPWKLRLMQLAIFSLTYVNYGVLHATRSSWSLVTADLRSLYGF